MCAFFFYFFRSFGPFPLLSLVIVVFFFFSFVVDVLVFILILCTRFFSTYFSFRYLLHCLPFGWRSIAQRFVFFSDASMNFFHCCCVCVCKKITYASFAFFAQCFVCVCVFHGIWCASLFSLVFLIICNFFAALNSFLLGIFVAIASITFPVRFFSLSLFSLQFRTIAQTYITLFHGPDSPAMEFCSVQANAISLNSYAYREYGSDMHYARHIFFHSPKCPADNFCHFIFFVTFKLPLTTSVCFSLRSNCISMEKEE